MEEDDELSLQITPSFKSRSKKSKGKGRSVTGDGNDDARIPEEVDTDDAANSSAVIFKKSARKSLGGAIGGSTSGRKKAESSNVKSKLSLSFGGPEDQEDGDGMEASGTASTSEVKRSDPSSRKLKRPASMLPNRMTEGNSLADSSSLSSSMSQASLSMARPSYSTEYLNELKASTPSTSSIARSTTGGSASNYDALTLSKFGNVASAEDDMDGPSTILPSENAIAAAKLWRETARRLGVDNPMNSNEDFVSLEVGMPRKGGESRLVREEDEIGEGEDDHAEYTGATERVPLGKKGRATIEKQRKAGMREAIDEVMAEEDDNELLQEDDEENREWELAQIRRGEQRRSRADAANGKAPYRPEVIPEQTSIPSLTSSASRLTAALQEVRLSKEEHDTILESLDRERNEIDSQERQLRREVERVNAKYEWFTETKGWVEDIASFLDEKFPRLEKVEADNDAIQKERMQLLDERRYRDDSDDVASFTGAEAVPVSYKEVEQAEDDNDTEMMEVDELGRTRRGAGEGPKAVSRQTRRQERKRRRALDTASIDVADGYETDDNLLASDSQDLAAAGEAMSADLATIFNDVASEDFRNPAIGVRPRFEDWKRLYTEEYSQAFGSIAMVGVWEFWARTELASWNPFGIKELPLAENGLETSKWHSALADFQHAREASAEPRGETLDPLDDTVNAMVQTVVVPRLRKLATVSYNPYSSHATSRALSIVEEITYCLETDDIKFQHLLMGFLSPFQLAVLRLQSLILPHLREIRSPLGGIDPDSITARNRIAQRMLKLLNNGLRWRKYAKTLVLPPAGEGEGLGAGLTWEQCLGVELVEKTMLPVLEAGWETGGQEIAQQVAALLPALPPTVAARLRR